jgi:hypothetical protein
MVDKDAGDDRGLFARTTELPADGAAVSAEGDRIATRSTAGLLRVLAFGQVHRALHVGEQNGDQLALAAEFN